MCIIFTDSNHVNDPSYPGHTDYNDIWLTVQAAAKEMSFLALGIGIRCRKSAIPYIYTMYNAWG